MKKTSVFKPNSIYAALDIGSSKIVCVVGKNNSNGEIEVLGYGSQATKSMKKGLIVDPSRIEEEIVFVVNEAAKITQTEISSVILNANITNSESVFLNGESEVGGSKIDELHIRSSINNSKFYNVDDNFEILHQIIRYFDIDKEKRVIDPTNFFADNLKVDIYQILVKKNYIKSLRNILNNTSLNIENIVSNPYASSLSTLIDDEKELGTICIDLGAGTTSVCIIENNKLIFAHAIPVGGSNITYDLASGLNTSIEEAERIKTLYGSVFSNPSDEHELIDVPMIGSDKNRFNQINISYVNSFIKPRVEETLELVRQKLKEYNLHKKNFRRVVLTGGGSLLEGINEYAKIIFDSQIRTSYPKKIEGINSGLNKPQFATVLGLLSSIQYNRQNSQFFHENSEKNEKNGLFSKFFRWLEPYI